MPQPSLFVHGGVAGVAKEVEPDLHGALAPLRTATRALDLVEQAIHVLENHPELNAGYGAVLDREGRLELDAGIVDGHTGGVGGVADVRVRHPITLARRVLEQTPHVLITGEGARAFGHDLEELADTTPEQRERWEKARAAGDLDPERFGAPDLVDTVGAVALDVHGHLAAGSSTGGVFGKMPGRTGDAPIFGAGIYASGTVAVVGTGVGELFLETLACARVGRLVEEGYAPQEACVRAIGELGRRDKGPAGLLALAADGRHGAAYRGGSWAVAGPLGPVQAVRLD